MALPILDGNQSATTLSTIFTSGAHIPAHTVVSLGSQAISDITSGVSGSVVSISNFPSTQNIAGTVTANVPLIRDEVSNNSSVVYPVSGADVNTIRTVIYSGGDFGSDQGAPVDGLNPLPITGSVNSTPLPISGTVTAHALGFDCVNNIYSPIPVLPYNEPIDCGNTVIARLTDTNGTDLNLANGVPISGTVTATLVGRDSSGPGFDRRVAVNTSGNTIVDIYSGDGSGPLSNSSGLLVRGSVTIGSVPNGSLTTRFGTPTTANTAFATSAVTNASRKYLLIQNVTTGSNVITVGIGFTPTTTQGIQLTAGAGITFESSYIPTGAVYVLSSVTASNFTILEA